jgi:hypothetical protein
MNQQSVAVLNDVDMEWNGKGGEDKMESETMKMKWKSKMCDRALENCLR